MRNARGTGSTPRGIERSGEAAPAGELGSAKGTIVGSGSGLGHEGALRCDLSYCPLRTD